VAIGSDWGCLFNSESENTGNAGWRLLTSGDGGELDYLLNTRSGIKAPEITDGGTTYTDCRYAMVSVNSMHGLMIFPNVFTWPSDVSPKPTIYNALSDTWNGVNYSVADFTKLDASGVVFLPTAGVRAAANVQRVNEYGNYWSSTRLSSDEAQLLFFTNKWGGVAPCDDDHLYNGNAVRLVHDVTSSK